MKLRLISLAMLAALLSVFVIAPMGAEARPQVEQARFQGLGGTVSDLQATTDGVTTTITGTYTQAGTGASDTFTTTLLDASGNCQILHLVLGPLDLDLLGLQVHLDQVVLDITAQPGPGNLLGNLLCGVAGLLDGGALGQLTGLLNQIFDILNGLLA